MVTFADRHLAFAGSELLAEGDLPTIALAILDSPAHRAGEPVLIFECASGAQVDIDLSGTRDAVVARLAADREAQVEGPAAVHENAEDGAREPPAKVGARGRPKLGVIGREVTLLPRHWAWLAQQRGGASAALRRLVDGARKDSASADRVRAGQGRGLRLMTALAGDLPGFEEAGRALFAGDRAAFHDHTQAWPAAVREQVRALAEDAFTA
ncbi:MAG TPA: DUF2239 family protein [Pseudomonadales bacterium]|nr:DUF2239 family protein [Pseudomonadales bacterium]